MAVYHDARCRLCRREGEKLMLKGDRCKTEKCSMERRPYPPGLRQMKRRKTSSAYSLQLREKQKMRRIYGVLEKQFRLYFKKAAHEDGVTGDNLLRMLECRFDNVVYRMGFAPSRSTARQLVLHNHFFINNKNVNIPSYQVNDGDVIQVKEKSNNLAVIHSTLKSVREVPEWLQIDKVKLSGTVLRKPDRALIPINVNEQLVVELYSK
jgi:small subunit ribosomal protein S4